MPVLDYRTSQSRTITYRNFDLCWYIDQYERTSCRPRNQCYRTGAHSRSILLLFRFSSHRPLNQSPNLSFHHTPRSFNTSGTHNVTIDTGYRVASISKAFTLLALLQL